MKIANIIGGTALAVTALTASADGNTPSNEELYEIIQAQQEQLDELTSGNSDAGGNKVHIGGYGELHYNNVSDQDDEIDFHRFVLFFGYDFNDRIRFRSELELEHSLAGGGDCSGTDTDSSGDIDEIDCNDAPGEVELEQAYIEGDINDNLSAKAGLFLIPVGILNETHEPPTFYGVERNNVEKNIIPTTWWEGGLAATGRHGSGLSWDVAFHSGLALPTSGSSAYKIRSGRQKVAEATANSGALTGRVQYNGVPGLQVAASLQHQFDPTQGNDAPGDDVDATLYTAHVIYNRNMFGARALYAHWDLSGDAPKAVGRDEQSGYYLEGSVKPMEQLGFYARHSMFDNEAGNSADTETTRWETGVNWWPHPDVVLKADVFTEEKGSNDTEGFNLGVGYQFHN